MGAILVQENGIVAHYKKKFNDIESRYTITEKEAFSIYLSINKCMNIIGGSKIIVFTDSKNNIIKTPDYSKRTSRWKALHCDLDIEYQFLSGKENIIADMLSRNTLNSAQPLEKTYEDLKSWHINYGHPGTTRSIQTLQLENKLSKNEKHVLINMIKNCEYCQRNKKNKFKYGKTKGGIKTITPFTDISTDVFGPITSSLYENNFSDKDIYIITFTDRCTGYTRIKFTKSTKSQDIIDALKTEWLHDLPTPASILSDNAQYYTSKEFQLFCKSKNIKNYYSTAYNPTGNSVSERINLDISVILRIYKHWNLEVIKTIIENRLNRMYNSNLKNTPQNILEKSITQTFPLKSKNALPKSNIIDFKYEKGNRVLIKNLKRESKLDDLFIGPYEIFDIHENYLIIIGSDKKKQKINVKNVKPFFEIDFSSRGE